MVPDGDYTLLLRDIPLSAIDNRLGAPAVLLRDPEHHHHWRIENRDDDTVVISLRSPEGRRLFRGPPREGQPCLCPFE